MEDGFTDHQKQSLTAVAQMIQANGGRIFNTLAEVAIYLNDVGGLQMEKFTFFWRTQSPFSQWHPCHFNIAGIDFNSAEQYMMYMKAKNFEDDGIAEQILKTKTPSEQKKLGRQVKNFNAYGWLQICKKVVYDASNAKFTQNFELNRKLLDTKGTTLVEASPDDSIWGIGLAEDHPNARNRSTWRGTNWLGEILTQLREDLIKAQ